MLFWLSCSVCVLGYTPSLPVHAVGSIGACHDHWESLAGAIRARCKLRPFKQTMPFRILATIALTSCFAGFVSAGYEAPDAAYAAPASYYSAATGTGATLRMNLHNIISSGFKARSYDDAKSFLQILDQDPNNPNNIILIYNGASVPGPWVSGGVTWNREHLWPQSLLGVSVTGSSRNAGTDLFELAPCNPSINSGRSNDAYGTVISVGTYQNYPTYFFPGDDDKGDIARAMMYMATRYYDGSSTPSTNNLSLVNGTTLGTYQMGDLQMLLHAHYQDGVDNFERRRNQYVYSNTLNPSYYQGNRNPFVDHPEYVWAIFGDSANNSQISVATPQSSGGSSQSLNLGTILVGGAFGTGTATLTKTGSTPTTYDVTASGITTTAAGMGQPFDYNNQSRSISLALSAPTSVGGLKSGTLTIHNTDLTSAGAGKGSADADDTIFVTGTVLSHSNGSLSNVVDVNSLQLNFGTIYVGSGLHALPFALSNLVVTPSFTATLDLLNVSGTGNTSVLSTNLAPTSGLVAGSSQSFLASMNAAVKGSYSATYTLTASDDIHLTGASSQQLTLTLLASVQYLPGDFNLDGALTADDLPEMLSALTNLNAYQIKESLSADDLLTIGDLDESGSISNVDIQPEIDRIIAVSGGLGAVPEPASLLSLLIATAMVSVRLIVSKRFR